MMRLILVGALAAVGCISSGAVKDARSAQVACLDEEIAQRQKLLKLAEIRHRRELQLIDCDELSARGIRPKDECAMLADDNKKLAADIAMFDRAADAKYAQCQATGAKADQIADRRIRQMEALQAAATAMQGVGSGLSAAGSAPLYRPPVSCTSFVNGNMVSTNCN